VSNKACTTDFVINTQLLNFLLLMTNYSEENGPHVLWKVESKWPMNFEICDFLRVIGARGALANYKLWSVHSCSTIRTAVLIRCCRSTEIRATNSC